MPDSPINNINIVSQTKRETPAGGAQSQHTVYVETESPKTTERLQKLEKENTELKKKLKNVKKKKADVAKKKQETFKLDEKSVREGLNGMDATKSSIYAIPPPKKAK